MLYNEPSPLETRVLTRRFGLPNSASIDTYLANDGYKAFTKAVGMTPEAIINEVKISNLRGRGGAGFPTGMKWSFVPRSSPKPKYIVVNADESEPGTCKDRVLMEYDPHLMIEGILIAGLAVDAHVGWIYIRGEYRYLIDIIDKALAEAYAKGWLGKNIQGTGFDFELYTHTGAGAYECGEESALLESLEGKRGIPRIRPPFPAVVGAFQCPTVLNNVETFCAVPPILLDGGKAFADLGVAKAGGTKLTCLTGHVNKPGVYELRLGFPVKQMIEEVGGGMRNGRKFKAFIPGGSSCPVLTAEECEGATMDYDSMAARKSMLGSGGVVIMDEDTCMVKAALRIMRFYAHESCGWCIPCREGTAWLRKILTRFHEGYGTRQDIDLIGDLSRNMLGRTFCPLGDAAALPTESIVTKFRHEFEDHLNGKPCPFEGGRTHGRPAADPHAGLLHETGETGRSGSTIV
ncbi:MAG: NADH-quinone oxidoreductase subunit NuoF [Bryobacteraceae bacterium]